MKTIAKEWNIRVTPIYIEIHSQHPLRNQLETTHLQTSVALVMDLANSSLMDVEVSPSTLESESIGLLENIETSDIDSPFGRST